MCKVTVLTNARVRDGIIDLGIPPEVVREGAANNEIYVIKKAFDPDFLRDMYLGVFHHYDGVEPQFNKYTWGMPNYWRVDNNPPKSSNKKIQVFYYAFPWNEQFPEMERVGRMLGNLRNRIAGLHPDYGFRKGDEWLCIPLLHHLPAGGGFISRHVDPLEPQRVVVTLSLGKGFDLGGVWVEVDGQPVSLEHVFEAGDIIIHRPDIPHGVAPVDPGLPGPDFRNPAGRWRMSTILVGPDEQTPY